jgi:hypothetical protein
MIPRTSSNTKIRDRDKLRLKILTDQFGVSIAANAGIAARQRRSASAGKYKPKGMNTS